MMGAAMKMSDISLRRLHRLHSQALARLTLRTFGEVHRIFAPEQVWLVAQVAKTTDAEGNAEPLQLMGLLSQWETRWKAAVQKYAALLTAACEQAASLPFGALVVEHNAMMAGVRKPVSEALTPDDVAPIVRLWQQRRAMALQTMERRVYGDGLHLSQRIWRLEAGGLERVRAQLAAAMTERTNAWQLATRLQGELGADANFPRWAWNRLYGMTPGTRATSAAGLLRGPEGGGQGVAYNALRLARNELQHANHAVATEIATHNPAVTGRYTVLSPGHPQVDICDEYAAGGPYDKTEEILPLHPQCMCYYKDALMPKAQFNANVRDWLDGQNNFLDDYSAWLGTRQVTDTLPWVLPIAESLELWLGAGQAAQAAALRV